MSAKFFALLTVIGANKLAKATALGTTLKITQMAVGDGGGMLPTPDTQQTKLVGEKRRAGLNTLFVDPKNDSQIIAEQVIPENEGGYWIREIGLFDDEGSLIAVGNCPETYKPQLQEGSGRTQTIRMILTVSHTESVELKVDPSVILATREFVNDAIESASKQTMAEVAKIYATKTELSTGLSKVQGSADDANTNANSRVPNTRKVNNKPLSADITLTAGDVGAATPAQVNEAKAAASNAQTAASIAQTTANNANNNANGRVPNTRKVNGKPLSADITLTAGDVGAGAKNTATKAVNGWWKCGDTGIMQQWNRLKWSAGQSLDFKFPTPFPNAVLAIMVTAAEGYAMLGTTNRSKTGFTLTGNASYIDCFYLAIGY